MVHYIQKLSDVSDTYAVFIIDLWGVVYDGAKLSLSAIETLENLKTTGKPVYLVTNNSGTRAENITKLITLGLARDCYTDLLSAGQTCLEMFLNNEFFPEQAKPLKAFVIEEELVCSWVEMANLQRVNRLCEADLILGYRILEESLDMSAYQPMLEEALEYDVLFVCCNPDLYVSRGNEKLARIGLLARDYEQMGGRVTYVGKPYPEIYRKIIDKHPDARFLMIGDSLVTDIKGASHMGFDAMLITMGNHKEELSNISLEDPLQFFRHQKIVPTFLSPQLLW